MGALTGSTTECPPTTGHGIAARNAVASADRAPLLPGAMRLAREGVRTSVADAITGYLSLEVDVEVPRTDPDLWAVLTDPQTSGGILLAVAEDRVDQLVSWLGEHGVAGTKVGSRPRWSASRFLSYSSATTAS